LSNASPAASSIVAAEQVGVDRPSAVEEARVPPRHDQPDAGVDLGVGIGELAGVEVPFQVIDRDQRHVERQG